MIRSNPYAASPACVDFAPPGVTIAGSSGTAPEGESPSSARGRGLLHSEASGGNRRDNNAFTLLNDPGLVAAMLTGGAAGERAFRRMVSISQPLLRQLAGRTLRAEEEIDEALQDIYLAVHRALPGFAARSKFTTWLYGLARHKLFDHLNRRIRRRREVTFDFCDTSVNDAPASCADPASAWDCLPDEHFRRRTLRRMAATALAALPDDYRRVFILREEQGLSGEETSKALGCSAVAVRVKLHRARHMVADQVRQALEAVPQSHAPNPLAPTQGDRYERT